MDILISEDFDHPSLRKLAETHDVVREPELFREPDRLKERIREARVILVRNQTQLTAEVLAEAGRLIGIGRLGVGLDNIDVGKAGELGIVVMAPLEANAASVAELALAFMLALARKIPRGDRSTKAGQWDRKGHTGIELAGKTVCICGFGRIGRKVAWLARAFGMDITVYDPFVKPDSPALGELHGALFTDLKQAVAGADFLSVHSPLTPETQHMFNREVFAAVKPGACFLNTSRGGVVDEAALIEALESGQLGAAALDVREQEPPPASALNTMDNVILMPHIGAWTVEGQTRTFEAIAGDVGALLRGDKVRNGVNFDSPRRS